MTVILPGFRVGLLHIIEPKDVIYPFATERRDRFSSPVRTSGYEWLDCTQCGILVCSIGFVSEKE